MCRCAEIAVSCKHTESKMTREFAQEETSSYIVPDEKILWFQISVSIRCIHMDFWVSSSSFFFLMENNRRSIHDKVTDKGKSLPFSVHSLIICQYTSYKKPDTSWINSSWEFNFFLSCVLLRLLKITFLLTRHRKTQLYQTFFFTGVALNLNWGSAMNITATFQPTH